jgi:hypothetical protein
MMAAIRVSLAMRSGGTVRAALPWLLLAAAVVVCLWRERTRFSTVPVPAPVPPWTEADAAALTAWARRPSTQKMMVDANRTSAVVSVSDPAQTSAGEEAAPVVLVAWTTFFGEAGFRADLGPGGTSPCPVRCLLENQRQYVHVADGVLFHASDLAWTDLPPRDVGGRAQPWTLVTHESPLTDGWPLAHPTWLRLFDFAMTYRRDADFPMTYIPQTLVDDVRQPLPVPVARRHPDVPVAWVASNCHAHNGRQAFVRALMRHVPVHSYGGCLRNVAAWPTRAALATWTGPRTAPAAASPRAPVTATDDNTPASVTDIMGAYMFYLALENSDCADYVTEKFFNALGMGAVPIVNGPRARYAAFMPHADAAVFVDEYPTAEALAHHLKALAANHSAYARHLRHRPVSFSSPAEPGADTAMPAPLEPWAPAFVAMAEAQARRPHPFCALCMRTHEEIGKGLRARQSPVLLDRHAGNSHVRTAVAGAHALQPDLSCLPSPFAAYVTWGDHVAYYMARWNVGDRLRPWLRALPWAAAAAIAAWLLWRRRAGWASVAGALGGGSLV